MNCNDCQEPQYNPTSEKRTCVQKVDAACVVYQFTNQTGNSRLLTLALPAGATLQQFMEAVDLYLAQNVSGASTELDHTVELTFWRDIHSRVLPDVPINPSVSYLTLQREVLLHLATSRVPEQPDSPVTEVVLSKATGNQLQKKSDGLFVPAPESINQSPISVDNAKRSVRVYATGTAKHTIAADVVIQSTANGLRKHVDGGLYIDLGQLVDALATLPPNDPIRVKLKQLVS